MINVLENISQNITFYFQKILKFAALPGIFIIGVEEGRKGWER